jgi:drug/metabolite transporter (DMT)-like permease
MSVVFARRAMDEVPPEATVVVSLTTNTAIFTVLALLMAAVEGAPSLGPATAVLFAAGGLCGSLVGRNLAYQGIRRIGPSRVTTIQLSTSVFALAFGLAVLRELPRPWQLVGMAIVLVALWLIVRPGDAAAIPGAGPRAVATAPGGRVDLAGVLFAFGGTAAFAMGDTVRRLALGVVPVPVVGAAIGASAALSGHLLWSRRHPRARFPRGAALRRFDLWAAAACNTVAILLLFVGLRYAPVAIVSLLYNLQVLVVLAASRILLGSRERIGPRLIAGALLALAGTAFILTG